MGLQHKTTWQGTEEVFNNCSFSLLFQSDIPYHRLKSQLFRGASWEWAVVLRGQDGHRRAGGKA